MTDNSIDPNAIAIVGLSGRFPQAENTRDLWQNLRNGVEAVTQFTDDELRVAGIPEEDLRSPAYVKAGAILEDIDLFDASFFGLTPREAQIMDPQQRIFLEEAYKAIEEAGYVPAHYDGSIGVFAGVGLSTYLLHNLLPNTDLVEAVGQLPIVLGNDKDSLTTRVAYLLDLTGPCLTVQTYCSTSLVAISMACEHLIGGACDMALAGGTYISVPQKSGYLYQEGGIMSPDARCRAFDAKAKGAPLGNGAAVILLKRLEDAVADGDTVHAVIKGWAVNNDGALRVGYTAPGVRGQAGVILEALTNSGIEPESISYIEAHGTGTALGDAIEFQALNKAFEDLTDQKGFCAIGSVKTNVGHLDRAAGVTGVIKAALALKNKQIPPSLNYDEPNPDIDFSDTPFFVNTTLRDWQESPDFPRRAGVNSFGMGGTNAHVVLEEAPEMMGDVTSRPYHLLTLSAKSEAALDLMTSNLLMHLEDNPDLDLADVAHTLQRGRRAFAQRRTLVASDVADAIAGLGNPKRLRHHMAPTQDAPVVFMFSGVGDQYINMGRDLYDTEVRFRQTVDECAQQLHSLLGVDIRELLYSEPHESKESGLNLRQMLGRQTQTNSVLQRTEYAQPVIFVIEYALAQLLLSWGIQPDALIGYSIGEYVAACVADIITLPDALRLVAKRAKLIQDLPEGAMLAVPLSAVDARPYLQDDVVIAVSNSPKTCVLSGTKEGIAAVMDACQADGIVCRLLETSHAFHSPMMTPIANQLTDLVRTIHLQPPQISLISNVTGTWLTDEQAVDPTYWAQHLCETVQFADGITELLSLENSLFLEIGAGQNLGSFIKQNPACPKEQWVRIVSMLRHRNHAQSDVSYSLHMLGALWLNGYPMNWQAFYGDEKRLRIPLPTYPFERKSYWIDPPENASHQAHLPAVRGKKPLVADWFYTFAWDETELPTPALSQKNVLLFSEDDQLAETLRAEKHQVSHVRLGGAFATLEDGQYVMRPDAPLDYLELWKALDESGRVPQRIIHDWSRSVAIDLEFAETQRLGYYSVLYLTQVLSREVESEVTLLLLTNHTQPIAQTAVVPEKAPLLAAARVIPQENPNIHCRLLDIDDQTNYSLLAAELMTDDKNAVTAVYREGVRYQQVVAPAILDPTQTRLKQGGVYLITGGLGAVGLTLADYLAEAYQAKLVLLGRSGLPRREEWGRYLTEDTNSVWAEKISRVQVIEQKGGQVYCLTADVTDYDQMAAAIQQAEAHFGSLNGVIHAAGLTSATAFQPIQMMERATSEAHFSPKVAGTYILEQVLHGRSLDFCLLMSSISTVLGGLGFSAYAAANLFMDLFAHSRNQQPDSFPWLSVNWDTWRVSTAAPENTMSLGGSIAEFEMTPEEGQQAFALALGTDQSQLINSTGDLNGRIKQWVLLETLQAKPKRLIAAVERPQLETEYVPATNEMTQRVAAIWQDVLGIDQVGIHDNFFDLGGNSLIGLQLINKIQKEFDAQIPAVTLFEAPTIDALVNFLQPEQANVIDTEAEVLSARRQKAGRQADHQGIAVIGMSGRFPGAVNVAQFWQNLCDGVESISWFDEDTLQAAGVNQEEFNHPNYIKARPIIADADQFDANFFGYSPREAELMDPQQRLFLECAWEALETAGYASEKYKGLIGVFGGANLSTYMMRLAQDPVLANNVSDYQAVIGNDKDALTTTVSYKLNLRGPSFAVQTFCSTSLVATHLACQSLLNGECDMALAGGVSVRVPQKTGYVFMDGGMESHDGHCRTFDAKANGTLFGDGVALVMLKRLDEALEDGDIIHAVLKGSAINNDGSLKVGYTAPSVAGQAQVVEMAQANAGVHPETIGYIEAHGTATELGDPIEVSSLTRAFRKQTDKKGYCAIGSVKTNMGHLDRAAGATALIKTVLSVKHGVIPPTLHYESPNPEIDFANSPFVVNDKLNKWPAVWDGVRRAGVNSLGMGGTNAHVVVEEPPTLPPSSPSRSTQLFLLSARTESALEMVTDNFIRFLQDHPTTDLADVAFTLQTGRTVFDHRRMLTCQTVSEALTVLESRDPTRLLTNYQRNTNRSVVFMFPGVGDHYLQMARDLYEQEETFRYTIERCCELIAPTIGHKIKDLLYPEQKQSLNGANGLSFRAMLNRNKTAASAEEKALNETAVLHPLLFSLEYALAQLLLSWGIQPQAMIGYSLGEYVVACLSGVFSLEDALRLVCQRAQMIEDAPKGYMLAVSLPLAQAERYVTESVSLAAHNGENTCVLAGEQTAIIQLESQLNAAEIANRRLPTSHAFHSHMLQPLAEPLIGLVESITLNPPRVPYISNVTGDWITSEEATDPTYWARHMCQPVRFHDGLQTLFQTADQILLEVGPGQSLGSFAKQHPACPREQVGLIMPTLRYRYDKRSDISFLLKTLGRLWLLDVEANWTQFYKNEFRHRVQLPTYPFERQRLWVEPVIPNGRVADYKGHTPEETISLVPRDEIDDWFYLPGWKQVAPKKQVATMPAQTWLLFVDSHGVGDGLTERLQAAGQTVLHVKNGTQFSQDSDTSYTIQAALRRDYDTLLRHLRDVGQLPSHIVHLWSVSETEAIRPLDSLAQTLDIGLFSLVSLVQALGEFDIDHCMISIVSTGVYNVTGGETICPEKGTLVGPCRVIPLEYANLATRAIDVQLPPTNGRWQWDALFDNLLGELTQPYAGDQVVALRSHTRWLQAFEPLRIDPVTAQKPPILRDGGVYLVTGGLGGIGLAMAEYLAETVRAKLVLLGRTPLPPRASWDDILEAQSDQKLVYKLESVRRLEALGAEVYTLAVDVADVDAVHVAVAQTLDRFGALHGVVHAAGVPGVGLTQLKTLETITRVIAPKVQGTLALEQALKDAGITLDFLALFSSITSVTGGGPGQIDYCAANAFLDAYAQARLGDEQYVLSINWGEWQWNAWDDGLSGYHDQVQTFFRENRKRFGIYFAEGADAFGRLLTYRLPQAVISTQDFRVVASLSQEFTAANILTRIYEDKENRPRHARPALGTSYVVPRNDLEQQISDVWGLMLGIDQVGIHDNFFDLGGNSLIGIDLITALRRALDKPDIPAHILYEAPTISALSEYFASSDSKVAMVEARQDRGEKRRAQLNARRRDRKRNRK